MFDCVDDRKLTMIALLFGLHRHLDRRWVCCRPDSLVEGKSLLFYASYAAHRLVELWLARELRCLVSNAFEVVYMRL